METVIDIRFTEWFLLIVDGQLLNVFNRTVKHK